MKHKDIFQIPVTSLNSSDEFKSARSFSTEKISRPFQRSPSYIKEHTIMKQNEIQADFKKQVIAESRSRLALLKQKLGESEQHDEFKRRLPSTDKQLKESLIHVEKFKILISELEKEQDLIIKGTCLSDQHC